MIRTTAGLLMHRRRGRAIEVLLVHPGGPLWAKKDLNAWSIPKGWVEAAEAPLAAAQREFREETGFVATPPFEPLGTVRQPDGKTLMVWAFAGDCDPAALVSNDFEMEWPPRSGKTRRFPEVDRAAWFETHAAREKIMKVQTGFLDALESKLRE